MGGICHSQLVSHAQLHISSLQHLPICKLTLGGSLATSPPQSHGSLTSFYQSDVSICSLQLLIYHYQRRFNSWTRAHLHVNFSSIVESYMYFSWIWVERHWLKVLFLFVWELVMHFRDTNVVRYLYLKIVVHGDPRPGDLRCVTYRESREKVVHRPFTSRQIALNIWWLTPFAADVLISLCGNARWPSNL